MWEAPDHEPSVAVSVWPDVAVPLTDGALVFVGLASVAGTASVWADVADVVPLVPG